MLWERMVLPCVKCAEVALWGQRELVNRWVEVLSAWVGAQILPQMASPMVSPRQDSLRTCSASWLCAPSAAAPYAAGSDPAIPLLYAVLLLLGLSFYSLCSSWGIVKTELQFNLLYSLGS